MSPPSLHTAASAAFGLLLATASTHHHLPLFYVQAYATGVGSCRRGFAKFPLGSEHNWEESTRPYGLLNDNYGDVAFSGMVLTLNEVELPRPSGSNQFHYTGECDEEYRCGLCQGGCEDDDGCEDGLSCYVRTEDEGTDRDGVPGCEGTAGLWDGTSYCYDPDAERRERRGRGLVEGELVEGRELVEGGRKLVEGNRELIEGGPDQTSDLTATAPFPAGVPLVLRLTTPPDKPFKGILIRLEGEDPNQDLSGTISISSDSNLQILEPSGLADGNGVTVMAKCAENVAAISHTEAEEKDMVEATIMVPVEQAGKASLEVTVMVGEHEWYLTNYVLMFDGPTTATTATEEEEEEEEDVFTDPLDGVVSELSEEMDGTEDPAIVVAEDGGTTAEDATPDDATVPTEENGEDGGTDVDRPSFVNDPADVPQSVNFPMMESGSVEFGIVGVCTGSRGECMMCQGDCDSNSECADGLVCYHRSANEAVPYCHGIALIDRDYCTVPDGTTPAQVMGATSGGVGKQMAAAMSLIGTVAVAVGVALA